LADPKSMLGIGEVNAGHEGSGGAIHHRSQGTYLGRKAQLTNQHGHRGPGRKEPQKGLWNPGNSLQGIVHNELKGRLSGAKIAPPSPGTARHDGLKRGLQSGGRKIQASLGQPGLGSLDFGLGELELLLTGSLLGFFQSRPSGLDLSLGLLPAGLSPVQLRLR
jgi:hypothetical protein